VRAGGRTARNLHGSRGLYSSTNPFLWGRVAVAEPLHRFILFRRTAKDMEKFENFVTSRVSSIVHLLK
jgi:hypothetical protein